MSNKPHCKAFPSSTEIIIEVIQRWSLFTRFTRWEGQKIEAALDSTNKPPKSQSTERGGHRTTCSQNAHRTPRNGKSSHSRSGQRHINLSVRFPLAHIINVFHEHRQLVDNARPSIAENVHILFGNFAQGVVGQRSTGLDSLYRKQKHLMVMWCKGAWSRIRTRPLTEGQRFFSWFSECSDITTRVSVPAMWRSSLHTWKERRGQSWEEVSREKDLPFAHRPPAAAQNVLQTSRTAHSPALSPRSDQLTWERTAKRDPRYSWTPQMLGPMQCPAAVDGKNTKRQNILATDMFTLELTCFFNVRHASFVWIMADSISWLGDALSFGFCGKEMITISEAWFLDMIAGIESLESIGEGFKTQYAPHCVPLYWVWQALAAISHTWPRFSHDSRGLCMQNPWSLGWSQSTFQVLRGV